MRNMILTFHVIFVAANAAKNGVRMSQISEQGVIPPPFLVCKKRNRLNLEENPHAVIKEKTNSSYKIKAKNKRTNSSKTGISPSNA